MQTETSYITDELTHTCDQLVDDRGEVVCVCVCDVSVRKRSRTLGEMVLKRLRAAAKC